MERSLRPAPPVPSQRGLRLRLQDSFCLSMNHLEVGHLGPQSPVSFPSSSLSLSLTLVSHYKVTVLPCDPVRTLSQCPGFNLRGTGCCWERGVPLRVSSFQSRLRSPRLAGPPVHRPWTLCPATSLRAAVLPHSCSLPLRPRAVARAHQVRAWGQAPAASAALWVEALA